MLSDYQCYFYHTIEQGENHCIVSITTKDSHTIFEIKRYFVGEHISEDKETRTIKCPRCEQSKIVIPPYKKVIKFFRTITLYMYGFKENTVGDCYVCISCNYEMSKYTVWTVIKYGIY